jgi:hypothetical protein
MVFNDGIFKEELLKTILLHGKTTSEDTDLTTKLNELYTELQGENVTTIKMKGTSDSFKGKLKLWKPQMLKGVLTHFPSVHSHADGIFDGSVNILCIDKLSKAFERRYIDSECMKFTVSFITTLFQEKNISEK